MKLNQQVTEMLAEIVAGEGFAWEDMESIEETDRQLIRSFVMMAKEHGKSVQPFREKMSLYYNRLDKKLIQRYGIAEQTLKLEEMVDIFMELIPILVIRPEPCRVRGIRIENSAIALVPTKEGIVFYITEEYCEQIADRVIDVLEEYGYTPIFEKQEPKPRYLS